MVTFNSSNTFCIGLSKEQKIVPEQSIGIDFGCQTQLTLSNKLKLRDRIYKCECGFTEDRDLKSARCIEKEGLTKSKLDNIIPTDYRNFKPEENWFSACFNLLININGIKVSKIGSLIQEASGLAPS